MALAGPIKRIQQPSQTQTHTIQQPSQTQAKEIQQPNQTQAHDSWQRDSTDLHAWHRGEVRTEGTDRELGGIPQLVAEEAIALHAQHVQVDVSTWDLKSSLKCHLFKL